ncbi:MAG: GNAT family N-acetyltransferase [Candidatus Latescibacteria bacterium]|jgi:hypothetical protein|nr:GNAT family N-acetyltransferase [Candidatus Latescibacterota bacterium]
MMGRSGRDYFAINKWRIRKLSFHEYYKLGWFDCGDSEINEFFIEDALPHKQELMAESYVFEYKNSPLALVSFQNDSIQFDDDENGERKKFGKGINLPFQKRYKSIPAIKLGRLGVHKEYVNNGVGSNLLSHCKKLFVTKNRTGCRLITVDSYIKRIEFYQNNDFILLPNQNIEGKKEDDTVIMYCDLKPYSNSPKENSSNLSNFFSTIKKILYT